MYLLFVVFKNYVVIVINFLHVTATAKYFHSHLYKLIDYFSCFIVVISKILNVACIEYQYSTFLGF